MDFASFTESAINQDKSEILNILHFLLQLNVETGKRSYILSLFYANLTCYVRSSERLEVLGVRELSNSRCCRYYFPCPWTPSENCLNVMQIHRFEASIMQQNEIKISE